MTRTPVVGLIGATIWGNRGAEAMLVTAIGQVRQQVPQARFYIFSYSPRQDARLVSDPHIEVVNSRPLALIIQHFLFACLVWAAGKIGIDWPDSLLPGAARALRACDVLLDVSGISFADGREKMLPFNILNMWPALLLGVSVVRLSQAMGSFNHPLTRWAAKHFLFRSKHVFARGQQTADFLSELGLPEGQWEQAADIAFLYQPEYSLSVENADRVQALVGELAATGESDSVLVGLSPSSLVHQKCLARGFDYPGLFLRLVETLPDNYRYVVVPNATREGSATFNNNDLAVIEVLRDRAGQQCAPSVLERLFWVEYDINTDGSRQVLAACDLVVTSRFHCMISSLCLQKPVIVVGWSHKYAEVMAAFNQERFVVDYADVTLDLAGMVDELLAGHETVLADLQAGLQLTRQASAGQFACVESILR